MKDHLNLNVNGNSKITHSILQNLLINQIISRIGLDFMINSQMKIFNSMGSSPQHPLHAYINPQVFIPNPKILDHDIRALVRRTVASF